MKNILQVRIILCRHMPLLAIVHLQTEMHFSVNQLSLNWDCPVGSVYNIGTI